MKTIQAKDYLTRADLELAVSQKYGLTPDKKEITIKGTRAELARLQLSDKNVFWGCSVEITDSPTLPKTQAKVERGKLHAYGIGEPKLGAKKINKKSKLKAKK